MTAVLVELIAEEETLPLSKVIKTVVTATIIVVELDEGIEVGTEDLSEETTEVGDVKGMD